MAVKKASQSTKEKDKAPAPVKLGNKRSCIKCGTKFYDFEKQVIVCPKCHTEMSPEDFASAIPLAPEPKRSKPEKVVTEALAEAEEPAAATEFESLEDLQEEEDDVADDIVVDDEDDNY